MNKDYAAEATYTTSRSGGKGGQNVNKVETKVHLFFAIKESDLLSEDEKIRLFDKLANKINNQGVLVVVNEESRSQLKNKLAAANLLNKLIEEGLKVKKPRKKSKPTKASKEKRLTNKKRTSETKHLRKPPLL